MEEFVKHTSFWRRYCVCSKLETLSLDVGVEATVTLLSVWRVDPSRWVANRAQGREHRWLCPSCRTPSGN